MYIIIYNLIILYTLLYINIIYIIRNTRACIKIHYFRAMLVWKDTVLPRKSDGKISDVDETEEIDDQKKKKKCDRPVDANTTCCGVFLSADILQNTYTHTHTHI